MISTIKVNETQEKRFGTEWIFKSAKSNQRFLICEEKTNKRNPKEKEKNRREADRKTWYLYFGNMMRDICITEQSILSKKCRQTNKNQKKKKMFLQDESTNN